MSHEADTYKTIRDIQSEYVRLIESHFTEAQRDFLHSRMDMGIFIEQYLHRSQRSQIVIPGISGLSLATDYRTTAFLQENKQFWDAQGEELRRAIRSLATTVISGTSALRSAQNVAKHCLFFDTTLIPDPSYRGDPERTVREDAVFARRNALHQILSVVVLKEAILGDFRPPMVIVYPELFATDDTRHAQEVSNLSALRERITLEYLKKVFEVDINCDSPIELAHEIESLPQSVLKKSINRRFIKNTFPPLLRHVTHDPILAATGAPRDVYEHLMEGIIQDGHVRYLAASFASQQEIIGMIEANAAVLNSDSVHWNLDLPALQFRNEILAREWCRHVSVSESSIVCHSFQQSFSWLEELPLQWCIGLRRQGRHEEIRNVFRVKEEILKTATVEHFEKACKDYEKAVSEAIDCFGNTLRREKAAMDAKRKKAVTSFTGSLLLAGVSLAFPTLLPVAAGSTIISLAFGGGSLLDILNAHLGGKRKVEQLGRRPLSVLVDLRSGQLDRSVP